MHVAITVQVLFEVMSVADYVINPQDKMKYGVLENQWLGCSVAAAVNGPIVVSHHVNYGRNETLLRPHEVFSTEYGLNMITEIYRMHNDKRSRYHIDCISTPQHLGK